MTAGLSLALFQQGCDSNKKEVAKKTTKGDANQVQSADPQPAFLAAKVEPRAFVATKLEMRPALVKFGKKQLGKANLKLHAIADGAKKTINEWK